MGTPWTAIMEEAEAQWSRVDRAQDAFSEIAQAVLEAHAPRLSRDMLLEHLTHHPQYPAQHDPHGNFGEPPITLARGIGFHLDAYFWVNPSTSVHNHIFTGAFVVLSGRSLHVEHDFALEVRLARSTVLVGTDQARTLELLQAGDVRPIARGLDLIHQVAHLSRPTISLVLRTSTPDPGALSYTFLMPRMGVADASRLDPSARRTLDLVRTLYTTAQPDADERLAVLLRNAQGPLHALWLLRAAYFCCHDVERIRRVASALSPTPMWLVPLLESLAYAGRHPVHAPQLVEERHRLLFALTAASQERAALVPVLEAFCEEVPWPEAVTQWTLELASQGMTGFWPTEQHAALLGAMLAGEDRAAALAESLGVEDPSWVAPQVESFEETLRQFGPVRVLTAR